MASKFCLPNQPKLVDIYSGRDSSFRDNTFYRELVQLEGSTQKPGGFVAI